MELRFAKSNHRTDTKMYEEWPKEKKCNFSMEFSKVSFLCAEKNKECTFQVGVKIQTPETLHFKPSFVSLKRKKKFKRNKIFANEYLIVSQKN